MLLVERNCWLILMHFFSLDCKINENDLSDFFEKRTKTGEFFAKNILLVISRTSMWMTYSRNCSAQNEYIINANIWEITRSLFGAQEKIIVRSGVCLCACKHVGMFCSRVISVQRQCVYLCVYMHACVYMLVYRFFICDRLPILELSLSMCLYSHMRVSTCVDI